ncbi:MAG: prenyltransferase [Thermoplasmatales archaeon]
MEQLKRIVDISSRGGKVPPVYVYIVFILPGFTFSILASREIHYIPFILSAISIAPLMAAVNLYDDYFDFRYGYDKPDSPNTIYRKHPIFYYKVKEEYLLKWALLFSVIYFFLISLDSYLFDFEIILIGTLGFILGYGYTGPPLSYKYHGMGEIGVFTSVLLANLLVSTACLGRVYFLEIIYSIPFSLPIVLVYVVGNARDMESDSASGLKTIPVILGKEGVNTFILILTVLFYLSIILLVFMHIYDIYSLFLLITSPFAYFSVSGAVRKKSPSGEWLLGPYVFISLLSLAILTIF